MRDGPHDKSGQGRGFDVLKDTGNDISFPSDFADDNGFSILATLPASLVAMTVAAVAADDGLVNNSGQLA